MINKKTTIFFAVLIFIAGMLFLMGFSTAMDATNAEAFCVSCHEMKSTVYEEYKESVHNRNISGVPATCADCHVPKALAPKLIRKIRAANDVYHWLLGSIDTKEKFESKRLELAKVVWRDMKNTDSRECRSCHRFEKMDFDEQDRSARKKHLRAQQSGKTCIDCHKGIAHELPDMDEDDQYAQSEY
ncbi:MAG: hypothetical protein GXP08_04180 [Gammaproteobacteria bacterium]|nr:hypothetical protein [Gammaproteobacteria bacterium]